MSIDSVTFDLDIVGVLAATDKSSSHSFGWDYLRHYEALLTPWRDQPINLIEIGVMAGASLNVWRRFFSRATIIGIDINPSCAAYARDGILVEIGSQVDPDFLDRICKKYPPTIIIDDGSHLANHIVFAFKAMFPELSPGGIYIVEDTQFHFGPNADKVMGDGTVSAVEYLISLGRSRMANEKPNADTARNERYILENVDSVKMIGGAVAIQKRKPHDLIAKLAFAEEYLKEIVPGYEQYCRLANYILHHSGPLELAERRVGDAIQLDGRKPDALFLLATIRDRQGKLKAAADLMYEAVRLNGDTLREWGYLANLELRLGSRDREAVAVENILSLRPGDIYWQIRLSDAFRAEGDFAQALTSIEKAALLSPDDKNVRSRIDSLRTQLSGSVA